MSYLTNVKPKITVKRTSKIGLLATFTANTDLGQPSFDSIASYLWTATPVGNVTFSSTTTATTNVTATVIGDVTITCTVTDNHGNTFSDSYLQKFERVIDVGNTNTTVNDYISSLQVAMTHISSNDNANASKYLITVYGTCTDTVRISPVTATVHFTNTGRLNVGVDFTTVGTYIWTGTGESFHVLAGTGTAFTLNTAGTTVVINGLIVGTNAAGANCVLLTANTTFTAKNCSLYTITGTGHAISANTATIECRNVFLVTLGGGDCVNANAGTIYLHSCYLQTNSGGVNLRAVTSNIAIYKNRFLATGAAALSGENLVLTNTPGIVHGNNIQVIPGGATTIQTRNVYMNFTGITGPVDFSSNHIIQSGGNNGTNSCCLMVEGASLQPIHIANNTINMLSTNPAMIVVQTAGIAAWRFINNSVCNQSGGASLTSSTTNGVVVIVALNNLNFFNNVWNGAINGPITFNAGTALTSENIRY